MQEAQEHTCIAEEQVYPAKLRKPQYLENNAKLEDLYQRT
jgi:hypothetical protein